MLNYSIVMIEIIEDVSYWNEMPTLFPGGTRMVHTHSVLWGYWLGYPGVEMYPLCAVMSAPQPEISNQALKIN